MSNMPTAPIGEHEKKLAEQQAQTTEPQREHSSEVERDVANVEAGGSTPPVRSKPKAKAQASHAHVKRSRR